MTILVTGAAGVLGQAVTEILAARGVSVRAVTRTHPLDVRPGGSIEEIRADLSTPENLNGLFDGVGTVIHCASAPRTPDRDRFLIDALIREARRAGLPHFVYVGIAGIDGVSGYDYYTAKRDCEQRLAVSGLPHSIVRITQFHPFCAMILHRLSAGPVTVLPAMTLQPVDVGFAAACLADVATGAPVGRAPDIHGPAPLDADALVAGWRAGTGRPGRRIRIPSFGPLKALGRLTAVQGVSGGLCWQDWAARTARTRNPYDR